MRVKKWIKCIWLYAVIGLLLPGQAVKADDKGAAEEFLKSNLDAVFEVLKKKDSDPQAKNSEVVEIVTPMFNFALMANFHWGGNIGRIFPGGTRRNLRNFLLSAYGNPIWIN